MDRTKRDRRARQAAAHQRVRRRRSVLAGARRRAYALYFKKGDPFDLEHWQVPEAFDWGKWDVDSQTPTSVRFRRRMSLVNYSGTSFDVEVDRTVRLLSTSDVETHFGASAGPGARMVAFESSNTVTNVGRDAWQPKSGLVSVWILGMFTPSAETTVTIPFQPGTAPALGPDRQRLRTSERFRRIGCARPMPSFSSRATGNIAARSACRRRARCPSPAATTPRAAC